MATSPLQLTFFETLRHRFPTWPEMRSYLESTDGGALRVIDSGDRFAVLRLVKGKSVLGAPGSGVDLFRSVVWDKEANRPVCMAPPKAREGMPPCGVQLAATEDFVDGFMMNAFVSGSSEPVLHLATRTQLGGSNTFYEGGKTFGDMFREALATTPLKDEAGLAAALEGIRGSGPAPTAFASFVVTHPDHRVVARPTAATLSVVHCGRVAESGVVELMERPVAWPQALARLQIPSYAVRQFRSEEDIQDLLRKTAVQRGWRWQGLVFKDGLGGRWRIRTPTYTLMRELRGSESAGVDRFLRLRAQGKVVDYLKHYREDIDEFWGYEGKLRARTADALAAYSAAHKTHTLPFKDLPDAYKPVVYQLHVQWLQELREKGFKVRMGNVIGLVNTLRGFEQRRLLEAEPFVAPVVAAAAAAAGAEVAAAE
jgi:hypothetical protein